MLRSDDRRLCGALPGQDPLHDGVADLLSALRADGVKLAALSNKADELTQRIIGALIGSGTFDLVIGAQPGLPLKPNPTAALLISTLSVSRRARSAA